MVATVCAFVLSLAVTQQEQPFDVRVSDPHLLRYEAVQQELKLSPDQVTRIRRAIEAHRAEAKRSGWNSDKERAAVAPHLSDAQLKRLREISLQSAGPIVLIVDFIAERVGASPARQKEIENTFHHAIQEGIKPMTDEINKMAQETMRKAGSDPDELEKRSKEVSRRADEISDSFDHEALQRVAAKRVLDSLTSAERRSWQELQGAPFPVEKLKRAPRSWD